MEIKGTRSFTLSKLSKLDLLVVRAALNEYYKPRLDGDATGSVALTLLNEINDYCDSKLAT